MRWMRGSPYRDPSAFVHASWTTRGIPMPFEEPPGRRPTVLVVEDDANLRRALVRTLAGIGLEVTACATCAEAHRARCADLGVLDIDLPDGDGARLAEELLRQGKLRRVVFFTAAAKGDVRARAARIGVVIDKSDGVGALLAALRIARTARPRA